VDVDGKAVSGWMFVSGVYECVSWIQLAQDPSRANKDVDLTFENLGTTDPTSRRHVPKELNLQLYRCEILKFSNLRAFLKKRGEFLVSCVEYQDGVGMWVSWARELGKGKGHPRTGHEDPETE
jgi:hypothetical protein